MQKSDINKIKSFEKKLYQKPIPVLPNTLMRIEDKLSKEQFNYEQLESLFKIDPLCLFNFLTCANQYTQNYSADFNETIKTPKHASMLLGIDNISKCIAKLTTLNKIENIAIANKIEQLACRSLHCAYQAKHLAKLMHDTAKEEVFLSALMMSLTELFIWFINPQKAQQYELLIFTHSIPEIEAQQKVFGFNFVDLIEHMEPKWRLPELYIETLKTEDIDNAKKSVIYIKLADKLSRLVDFGWYSQDVYDHINYCASLTPFSEQRIAKEFHHIAVKMSNKMHGFYKFALPASNLLLQTGKIPYYPVLKLKDKEKQNKAEQLKKNKQISIKAPILNKSSASTLENVSNLPSLIKMTISKLYQSDNFDQVLLLLLSKSKKEMMVSIEETQLKNLVIKKTIPISTDKNLFKLLLEKPHPIYINPSNIEKYKDLITKKITDVLPAKDFFAKAFYYKNKPIGIFYVSDKDSLNTDTYSFFIKTLVDFEKYLSRLT